LSKGRKILPAEGIKEITISEPSGQGLVGVNEELKAEEV
jgi:hypothetical protein